MSIVAGGPGTRPDAPGRREPAKPRSAGHTSALGHRRRRVALAGGLLAALAIAATLVFVLGGSGEAPPATGAATIVPADALAYVNLSTDPSRPAVGRARTLAARFPDWPLLAASALKRLDSIVGGSSSADFATGIRPWLGNEVSLALLPSGATSSPQPLVVLAVARPSRARSFVTRAGAVPDGAYDGIRLLSYPSKTELAFVGRYLVAGSVAGVRAAIDAARGRVRPLAHDGAYERATAGEPPDRVLDAYLSAPGVRRLLASRTGLAGALGVMLGRPALAGTAISLSAVSGGARVLVHSVLRAGATRANGSRPVGFRPTLQSVLPSGSTLMLDVAGLHQAAPGLLRAAATAGIAANVGPLLSRLGTALASEGVNLRKVLSIFDGETAVALAPGATPALLIVARLRNEAAARADLASLEAPMTALFPASSSGGGQVAELADIQADGVTVHELGLGPGLQVDYAVFDGLAVISTSVAAIDAVAARRHSLAQDAAYRATLSDQPQRASSLLFLDFPRLLKLGEQTGLTSGARIGALLPDLSKVRAIGLSSTSGDTDTTTELSLEIP
jgi:hypothetical protein